jgi:hypothetical protein
MIGLSLVGIGALWWAQNNALQSVNEKASYEKAN